MSLHIQTSLNSHGSRFIFTQYIESNYLSILSTFSTFFQYDVAFECIQTSENESESEGCVLHKM